MRPIYLFIPALASWAVLLWIVNWIATLGIGAPRHAVSVARTPASASIARSAPPAGLAASLPAPRP